MILVAGIGNIFFGDDGFGCEVARRLAAVSLPEEVCVIDFGIRGLDLAFALLDPYEQVILIDAASRGGSPGTLYVIEPALDDAEPTGVEAHSMDPVRVLAFARSLGARLGNVCIIACEPESL